MPTHSMQSLSVAQPVDSSQFLTWKSYVILSCENSRGLFPFRDHLLNWWTKVISALIPENITVYLFQKQNVHLSWSIISYFWANFLFVTKHFPQFHNDTHFRQWLLMLNFVKSFCKWKQITFSFYPLSIVTYACPFKGIYDVVSYTFLLWKWHCFPHYIVYMFSGSIFIFNFH